MFQGDYNIKKKKIQCGQTGVVVGKQQFVYRIQTLESNGFNLRKIKILFDNCCFFLD